MLVSFAAAALVVSPAAAVTFGKGIWLTQSEIAKLPMSGTAWTNLKSVADGSWGSPNLADGSSNHDVYTLAGALVYVRTGNESYRTRVVNALKSVAGTEGSSDSALLALGRNLVSYVIAADLVGFNDSAWRSWLSGVRTKRIADKQGSSLVGCHATRANNWGTNCGASRIAADVFLGDTTDLGRAVQVYRGWLGDRSQYSGFNYGDLDWQCDPSKPVGINPKGCTKQGHSIDGVLPDDQRRAGGFTWPPPKEDYVWGALGPALVQGELLYRAGYTQSYQWSDSALKRALAWLHVIDNFPSTGDNRWATWLGNFAYGTSYPSSSPTRGKSMAWTDWTHARTRGSSTTTSTSVSSGDSSSTSETPSTGGSETPTVGAKTFLATADAHVNSLQPSERYGELTRLRTGGKYRTYITFTVTGLSGSPASTTLRLQVADISPSAISVYRAAGAVSDATTTWSSAPALTGNALGSFRASTDGASVDIDLGGLVTENGTYTVALVSSDDDFAAFSSREGSRPPALVLG